MIEGATLVVGLHRIKHYAGLVHLADICVPQPRSPICKPATPEVQQNTRQTLPAPNAPKLTSTQRELGFVQRYETTPGWQRTTPPPPLPFP